MMLPTSDLWKESRIKCRRCSVILTQDFHGCHLDGCLNRRPIEDIMGKKKNRLKPFQDIQLIRAKDITPRSPNIISSLPEVSVMTQDQTFMDEFGPSASNEVAEWNAMWEAYESGMFR